MKHPSFLISVLLASAVGWVTPDALACGEGMFSAGNGLLYQSYLAPRPATVLVFARPGAASSEDERQALLAGLQNAGHILRVAESSEDLASALREQAFDVVIADFAVVGEIEQVAERGSSTLLPVVPRSERRSQALRDRFDHYVLDGASLGEYLKTINGVMKLSGR